jgi:serine/threonine protein kinase
MNPPAADDTRTALPGAPSASATAPHLGPFRILAELGRGGMGAVYRAHDTRLDREVALKVLLPNLSADPKAKARFLREARAQAKVEHDHIIPIHDVGETEGVAYLVMPLLKGQSLGAALKQNRHPPLAEAVRIVQEMAEGLAAAHDAGLIHRDIKPGNVWLEGAKRRVKILDFGLARTAHDAADAHPVTAAQPVPEDGTQITPAGAIVGTPAYMSPEDGTQITPAGAIVGTPAYMSPEQARGQAVDARSDLFALGVVLYKMATGRKPFTGSSSLDVLAAVVAHDPPAARELNAEVPPALSDLIRRLMAKDASERPSSAAQVAEELEALGRGLAPLPVVVMPVGEVPGEPNPWEDLAETEHESPTSVPAETVVPTAAAPRANRKPLLFAAGAVLLAGAVVAAVVVAMNGSKKKLDPEPEPPPVAKVQKQEPKTKDPLGGTVPSAFFNGKDLTGFEDDSKVWTVEGGAIVGKRINSSVQLLTTGRRYSDFELSFSMSGSNDPRIFFRASKTDKGGLDGPYIYCGGSFEVRDIGGPKGAVRVTKDEREFHDFVIRCEGRKLLLRADGKVMFDGECALPPDGFLGWTRGGPADTTIRDIKFTDLTAPK